MLDVLSLDRTQLIEKAVREFKEGKFLLVSDDEDRENEGDLVIAAEHATPEAINFMITEGKGLVCLSVSDEIARQKGLTPMVERNGDHLGTAFTASVDATPAHGVTTGISAWDRAKTIEVVVSDTYKATDLQAPGHMFPLVARPGYLKARRGHTEAGVELCRLAGLQHHAAVIVEVIREDGEMARRPELLEMAEKFGISYVTIDDLCKYVGQFDLEAV
ncbi:3,4-dihydroxy-2-butanone-4-phosphate synthase [uncultured Roseobacter sp.]|uniref:3,4-dihydroxy-2-butanone-4-phosphate synthase n=1 Tax=uncultured Roseobacter sp. TaxID=114847 RepID=UPI0026293433|nr:3,4-dihydroxy-2-butanone-4-phosphate synthase [uncultured Roseobacter sp.]